MLFDVRPKEYRKDLYDREKEIEMIKDSIQRKTWIVVLGMKRVGKTSIVNVSVNETNSIVLNLNLMRIYNPKKSNYPRSSFINLFLESINSAIKKYTLGGKVLRVVSNVLGIDESSFIDFNAVKIRAGLKKFRNEDIGFLTREMDELAKDNGKNLVIIFDEAQELAKVNGINFSSVFHDIYDYCKNTTIIFTGSMIGILEKVLKNIEYEKPFFGRYIRRIYLERFDREASKDFLVKGFEEEGVKVSDEVLEDALNKFDGVPGWLTFFGSEYSFSLKHNKAIKVDDIVKMAIKEVKEETKNFILSTQSKERYSATILALERLGGKGELKQITKVASSILGEDVPEPRIYEILNRLLDYGFIEKQAEEYSLLKDLPNKVGVVEAASELLSSQNY